MNILHGYRCRTPPYNIAAHGLQQRSGPARPLPLVVTCWQSWNYNVCAVFLLDATFITDPAKFMSGALLSLSAMVQLELPHLNVLTKCDLADRSEVRPTR